MRNIRNLMLAFPLVTIAFSAFAQDPDSDKQKQMLEAVDKQVETMTDELDLEDWQVFYVDSILTANYKAIQDGLDDLNAKKVSNRDIYLDFQYKKLDEIYYELEKVLDENQWAKYLKRGAAKDKKTREKYQARRNK